MVTYLTCFNNAPNFVRSNNILRILKSAGACSCSLAISSALNNSESFLPREDLVEFSSPAPANYPDLGAKSPKYQSGMPD